MANKEIELTLPQKWLLAGIVLLTLAATVFGAYEYTHWNDRYEYVGEEEIEFVSYHHSSYDSSIKHDIIYKDKSGNMFWYINLKDCIEASKLKRGDILIVSKYEEIKGGFKYIKFPNLKEVILEKVKDR